MNKSMLIGVVAGITVATAGGVAAYSYLGQDVQTDAQGSALAMEETITESTDSHTAMNIVTAAVAEEECWDEEVTVQADPRDEHAIAGTAAGALIGGALAKKIGDDRDLATAAGAAAGAYLGRRAQREFQENNTTTTIERRCAPVGTR